MITDGKYAILSPETLLRLVDLLDDANSEIRLNSIKLLSLLAETPKGKQALKSSLSKVLHNLPINLCLFSIMIHHTAGEDVHS